MSKIIFITSEKEIDLKKYGLEFFKKSDFLIKHFPYLKDKNYIYDFSDFNYSVSYKDFVLNLIKLASFDNVITVAILWQTENLEEIENLNTIINETNIITQSNNYDDKYKLIYGLENDNLTVSSEFIIN